MRSRLIIPASVLVFACVALATMQAQRQGGGTASGGQDAGQTAAGRGDGQRGAAAPTRPSSVREIW